MESGKENKDLIYAIDVYDVLSMVWRKKLIVTLIVTAFSILSVLYALSLQNQYTSSALVAISSDETQNSSLSQYAGLASMVGVNLPSQSSENKIDLAIETLKSKDFFRHLLNNYNFLLRDIYASKSYDMRNNKIIYDDRIYDENNDSWVRKAKFPLSAQPSYIESHEHFLEKNLRISNDVDTGYITISIEHFSPIFAKNLVDLMISELNNQIRKRDKEEANKAVEYLLEERNNNPVMSVTEAIDSLIESQLRTIMLTEIRDDYIIKIIDSAHLPEKKSKPSRAIICIIGFFLGLFVAATYIIFNHLRSINK